MPNDTAPSLESCERHCRTDNRSLSLLRGNALGTLLATSIVVGLNIAWALVASGPPPLRALIDSASIPALLTILVALSVGHEALHASTWIVLNRGRSSFRVKFGVQWRYLMPYANPVGPMPVWINRVGGLAPAVFLGFLPLAAATWVNEPVLAGWAIIMIGSSAGDFLIFWQIRGLPGSVLVEDLPDRIGVIVHWEKWDQPGNQ